MRLKKINEENREETEGGGEKKSEDETAGEIEEVKSLNRKTD